MGLPAPYATPTEPSTLQTLLISHPSPSTTNPYLHHLALQIAHNLRHQHNWTSLRIRYPSADNNTRPLISGLPPQRTYIHPDEQIELLQKQKSAGKLGLPELEREREWVLPSQLREKWSLSRFGEVFDSIPHLPGDDDGESLGVLGGEEDESSSNQQASSNPWRISKPKRLLLATLDDDSTITYYIVHDGIVKPRQN